ncbi:DUF7169 domain-containing protein [Micromonospora arida]|uniref:DUF7169 domain-containing protein n=1 Tax=Micromonospora arida TaxID=2203715 RepID=UPI003CF7039E
MTPADLDKDPDELRFRRLLELLAEESAALTACLPAALDAQWSAAPIARPREDTTERAKGLRSDPTANIVLDDRRQHLRTQLVTSMTVLQRAVVTVRGVRRGLEMTLAAWDGEGSGDE